MDDHVFADGEPTTRLAETARTIDLLRDDDPRMVDEYAVLGRIPGNHLSDVFLVEHDKHGSCVLKLSSADGSSDLERTLRESAYLARVRSHRVAKVVDSATWHGRAYFVQEFIDGPTLADLMYQTRGKPLTHVECYRAAVGLAEAVRDVHRADVLHRDIKPANIIVHATRGVILVDFGIARSDADPHLTQGMALGTPRYMSPEQLSHEEVEATDVFQWGLVVGEAVLGQHPIVGIDEDGRDALLRCRADPRLSGSLGRLVADSLQRSPDHRPTIHQILAELERTEVFPGPQETVAIPVPQRRLSDARSLDDLMLLATPHAHSALEAVASNAKVYAAGLVAAGLVGVLLGFLVGIILGAPWGNA